MQATPLREDPASAGGNSRVHEVMTVAVAPQGHEQLPGSKRAGVDGDAAHLPVRLSNNRPAGGGRDPVGSPVHPMIMAGGSGPGGTLSKRYACEPVLWWDAR